MDFPSNCKPKNPSFLKLFFFLTFFLNHSSEESNQKILLLSNQMGKLSPLDEECGLTVWLSPSPLTPEAPSSLLYPHRPPELLMYLLPPYVAHAMLVSICLQALRYGGRHLFQKPACSYFFLLLGEKVYL